ncbi:serine protease 29-like [Tamandua tetradactyla]|uniref:serine protease 29-like n=1 Tax=Tamandua tetradactyla TaxID=48850 RepID=UPI00405458DA
MCPADGRGLESYREMLQLLLLILPCLGNCMTETPGGSWPRPTSLPTEDPCRGGDCLYENSPGKVQALQDGTPWPSFPALVAPPFPIPGEQPVRIRPEYTVPEDVWPWHVSLRIRAVNTFSWNYICPGVLIHPRWVLTSAQCIFWGNTDPKVYRVQGGNAFLYMSTPMLNVSRVVINPNFNPATTISDLALLLLEKPVRVSWKFRPVALPPESLEFTSNDDCRITAWDIYSKSSMLPPPYYLKEDNVQMFRGEDCKPQILKEFHNYKYGRPLHSDTLCARRPLHESWMPDVGSPLVCKKGGTWFLLGVLSWDLYRIYPPIGIYARVQTYMSWIQQQINGTD